MTVEAGQPTGWSVSDELMGEMRSSILFLGPILGRMGEARLSFPGGCQLGPRPIDLHLSALRTLGAEIKEEGGHLTAQGALTGTGITLSLPSVGATENVMLSAVMARGVTTLTNAAREPEIVELQEFLNTLGADVQGAGSSVITIRGGRSLHGGEYTVMADRIVCATYLAAVAAAGGEAELVGADWRQVSPVTAVLSEAGCRIRSREDTIWIRSDRALRGVRPVRTGPYPGFPTDAQAPVMAALCRSEGTTVFVENMFQSRFGHVDELCRMGADIRTEGKVAVVYGVPRMTGARVRARDLRGGGALAVAALGAEGESIILGVEHMDRGYADLAGDLAGLGAQVIRQEIPE